MADANHNHRDGAILYSGDHTKIPNPVTPETGEFTGESVADVPRVASRDTFFKKSQDSLAVGSR